MLCKTCGTSMPDAVLTCPSCGAENFKTQCGLPAGFDVSGSDGNTSNPTTAEPVVVSENTLECEPTTCSETSMKTNETSYSAMLDSSTTPDSSSPYVTNGSTEWSGREYGDISGVPARTAERQDVVDNKFYAAMAYFSLLFLIPLLARKSSPYAQFHAWQGIRLTIAYAIYRVVYWLLGIILLEVSPMLGILLYVLSFVKVGFLILAIIGNYYAWAGITNPLPIIGTIGMSKNNHNVK